MFTIRTMLPGDFDEVAELIYHSTNSWYQENRGFDIFTGGAQVCRLFCEVYEDLDPSCALVAAHDDSGKLMGSCFVHPRETHVSLGIMNVHPDHFGDGVAGALMDRITGQADQLGLPLRLVSSAMNLDSFSLYSRKGLSPYATYQDVIYEVSETGMERPLPEMAAEISVTQATSDDVADIVALERDISGISREQDYRYFIENASGIWQTLVVRGAEGALEGFLVSVDDPGSRMIGPGVSRSAAVAAALTYQQLDRFRGKSVVCLCPSDQPALVQAMYAMGGRNCEIHLGQCRGETQEIRGVVMPTFMPETS